jgi:hypothetical protein
MPDDHLLILLQFGEHIEYHVVPRSINATEVDALYTRRLYHSNGTGQPQPIESRVLASYLLPEILAKELSIEAHRAQLGALYGTKHLTSLDEVPGQIAAAVECYQQSKTATRGLETLDDKTRE